MTIKLKEATASQEVPLGYFLDITNGNDEETGLTIANTDIKIWKSGATTLANKNSGGGTHISNGIYYTVLDATDTNTLGPMVIFVHISATALPVRLECEVIPSNIYDSLYSTDKLQVDVTQCGGSSVAAGAIPNAAADAAGGLPISDAGALDLDGVLSGNVPQGADNNTILAHADYGNAKLVRSTTPANTLDVSATGEAGLDFANIKDATGAHTLTNITVPVTTDVTNEVSADAVKISGDSVAADNLELDYDGTGYVKSNSTIGTCTSNTDMRGTDSANTVVPDVAGTAATLHGVTDGKIDTVGTNVTAVLLDTGTTIPGTITSLQTDSTAIKAKTDNLPSGITKNVALSDFSVLMVLSSDGTTVATGKTVVCRISKDGSAFSVSTNSVTEISNGMYTVDLTQTEMNADAIILRFTNADCLDRLIVLYPS